jgi:hypothetical protein
MRVLTGGAPCPGVVFKRGVDEIGMRVRASVRVVE